MVGRAPHPGTRWILSSGRDQASPVPQVLSDCLTLPSPLTQPPPGSSKQAAVLTTRECGDPLLMPRNVAGSGETASGPLGLGMKCGVAYLHRVTSGSWPSSLDNAGALGGLGVEDDL